MESVVLACPCLNIALHTKSFVQDSVDLTKLKLSEEEKSDDFFQDKVTEVEMAALGVTCEHSYLKQKRKVGDWHVTKCLICNVSVFAKQHYESRQILASKKVLVGKEAIKNLQMSDKFSPAFRILLERTNDNELLTSLGSHFLRKAHFLEATLHRVNLCLARYLKREQTEMENRISSFREAQKFEFAHSRERALFDKAAIVSILMSLDEPTRTQDNNSASSSNTNKLIPSVLNTGTEVSKIHVLPEQLPVSRFSNSDLSSPTPVSQDSSLPIRGCAMDANDDVFFLEDLNNGNEEFVTGAFYESDDEIDTDDSSSTNEPDRIGSARRYVSQIMPHSLPVAMPDFGSSQVPIDNDSAGQVHPECPEDMAASIKALAQSVHGSDIFGELPRPRLFSLSSKPPLK